MAVTRTTAKATGRVLRSRASTNGASNKNLTSNTTTTTTNRRQSATTKGVKSEKSAPITTTRNGRSSMTNTKRRSSPAMSTGKSKTATTPLKPVARSNKIMKTSNTGAKVNGRHVPSRPARRSKQAPQEEEEEEENQDAENSEDDADEQNMHDDDNDNDDEEDGVDEDENGVEESEDENHVEKNEEDEDEDEDENEEAEESAEDKKVNIGTKRKRPASKVPSTPQKKKKRSAKTTSSRSNATLKVESESTTNLRRSPRKLGSKNYVVPSESEDDDDSDSDLSDSDSDGGGRVENEIIDSDALSDDDSDDDDKNNSSSESESYDESSKSNKRKKAKSNRKSGSTKKSKAKRPAKLQKRFEKLIIRPLSKSSEDVSPSFWSLKDPLTHKESHRLIDCCGRCASREVFRALELKKTTLLTNLIHDVEHVSDVFIRHSIDMNDDALCIAIENHNLPAVQLLLHQLTIKKAMGNEYFASSNRSTSETTADPSVNGTKDKSVFSKPGSRVPFPISNLENVSTGSNSIHFLGHATKSINVSRGNREGNNALSKDVTSDANSDDDDDDNDYTGHGDTFYRYFKWACQKGNVEIIELFAHAIIPQNDFFKNPSNSTTFRTKFAEYLNTERPLALALKAGNLPVFRYLMKTYMEECQEASDAVGATKLIYLVTGDNEPLPVFRAASATKKTPYLSLTPVHVAAINPNVKYLQTLVQIGGLPILNVADSAGYKAIHYAAVSASPACLEFLLSAGINPLEPFGNRFNPQTPLHLALAHNRVENVKILIAAVQKRSSSSTDSSKKAQKSKLFIKDSEVLDEEPVKSKRGGKKKNNNDLMLLNDPKTILFTPSRREKRSHLHTAASHGFAELISVLINAGCDPFLADKEKLTPLHIICHSQNSLESAKALLESAIKAYEKDEAFESIPTLSDKHLVIKSKLLMARDRNGRLPIHHAVKNGLWSTVQYLLSQGVPAGSVDSSDNTCLHYACAYGYFEIAELLIAAGASCTSLNMWKLSPLMISLLKNHIKCAEVILRDKSVSVDDVDSEGKTCLIHALIGRNSSPDLALQKVRYLVEGRSANVKIADVVTGRTALHYFCESRSAPNDSVVLELLFKHGALEIINTTDLEGKSPLLLAISSNNTYCVQALLGAGASCDVLTLKDGSKITPLIAALQLRPNNHSYDAFTNYIDYREKFLATRHTILKMICQSSISPVNLNSISSRLQSNGTQNNDNGSSDNSDWCNVKLNNGLSALHIAISGGTALEDCKLVLSIPNINVNITSGTKYGATPLATLVKDPPTVGYAYKINDKSKALDIFSTDLPVRRYIELVQLLLDHRADPTIPWRNFPDPNAKKENEFKLVEMPLLVCALQTNLEYRFPLFSLLVKVGTPLDQRSTTNDNILHYLFGRLHEMQLIRYLTTISEQDNRVLKKLSTQYNDMGMSPTLVLFKECISLLHGNSSKSTNPMTKKDTETTIETSEIRYTDFDVSSIAASSNAIIIPAESDTKQSYQFNAEKFEALMEIYKTSASPNLSDAVQESVEAKQKRLEKSKQHASSVISSNLRICKYGAECYRTHNPVHMSEFRHPHLELNNVPQILASGKMEPPHQVDLAFTALHMAITQKNEVVSKWLILNGTDLCAKDWKGRTPLIATATVGFHSIVDIMLRTNDQSLKHKQLTAVDDFGATALHHAVCYSSTHNNDQARGFDEAFITESYLLRAGSNPNVKDSEQRTPLHYLFIGMGQATNYSGSDPIELLSDFCSATATTNLAYDEKDIFGRTPLIYCAMRGAQICSSRLISLGAKRDSYDNDGNGLLQHALLGRHLGFCMTLMNCSDIDMMRPIVEIQEIDKKPVKKTKTPFRYGIELRDAKWSGFLYVMIDSGLVMSVAIEDALTTHSFSLMLKLINKSTANQLNATNAHGKNLLHTLAEYQAVNEETSKAFNETWAPRICRTLEDLKINLVTACATLDEYMRTPLHYAALKGHVQFTAFLLNIHPQAANVVDYQSRTPLHLVFSSSKHFTATRRARIRLIRLLMPATRMELISNSIAYETILKAHEKRVHAQQKSKSPSVQLIAPPVDKATLPVLHCAVRHTLYDEAYLLLLFGMSPNVTNETKQTPLMISIKENSYRFVKILLHNPTSKSDDLEKEFEDADDGSGDNNTQILSQYRRQPVTLNLRDVNGATILHHLVYPMGYCNYSYENVALFAKIVEYAKQNSQSLPFNIKDNENHTAMWYAAQQSSNALLTAFIAEGAKISDAEKQDAVLAKVAYLKQHPLVNAKDVPMPTVDVDKDAEAFKYFFENGDDTMDDGENENEAVPETAEVDPEDLRKTCVVHREDSSLYDILLTYTDVGSGRFGKHTFYKMQLLHNSAQDLWILFTRWGRIGDRGEMQRTPISTKENAIKEFCKIFKSKSGNDWDNRSKELFVVKPGKYVVQRTKKSKNKKQETNGEEEEEKLVVDLEKLLKSKRSILPKSGQPYWVYYSIYNMLNMGALNSASFQIASYSSNDFISEIESAQLQEASTVLKTLEGVLIQYLKVQKEAQALRADRNLKSITSLMDTSTDDNISSQTIDGTKSELAVLDEKISSITSNEKSLHSELVTLSNRFFTLVPIPHFTRSAITEIDDVARLGDIKHRMSVSMNLLISLHILIGLRWHLRQIELHSNSTSNKNTTASPSSVSSRIANIERKTAENGNDEHDDHFEAMNPIDYTLSAINTKFAQVDPASNTFGFIKQYMSRSSSQYHLMNVFEVYNEDHVQRNRPYANSENRRLLWHGSSAGNFCGILKDGLRIAPPEAYRSGAMFGNGIYFGDQFAKSIGYCFSQRNYYHERNEDYWLLLCEVALGNMFETKEAKPDLIEAPQGYDSTYGIGTNYPDQNQRIISPNGVIVPYGPIISHKDKDAEGIILDKNEFIVYQVERVLIRYVIHVKTSKPDAAKLKPEIEFYERMGRMRLNDEDMNGVSTNADHKSNDDDSDHDDDEDDIDSEDEGSHNEDMDEDEDMNEEDD